MKTDMNLFYIGLGFCIIYGVIFTVAVVMIWKSFTNQINGYKRALKDLTSEYIDFQRREKELTNLIQKKNQLLHDLTERKGIIDEQHKDHKDT